MFSRDRDFGYIVHLLPPAFWNLLHFTGSRRQTLTLHEWIGVAMAFNGLFYLISSLRSGAWRNIVPRGSAWLRDAVAAAIAELRAPAESMRSLSYNAAQRAAYTGTIAMGTLMVITGGALWFKHQVPWFIAAMGGERLVLPLHIILATGFIVFILIHVVQVLRAGLPTLLSMTIGNAPKPTRTPINARSLSS